MPFSHVQEPKVKRSNIEILPITGGSQEVVALPQNSPSQKERPTALHLDIFLQSVPDRITYKSIVTVNPRRIFIRGAGSGRVGVTHSSFGKHKESRLQSRINSEIK